MGLEIGWYLRFSRQDAIEVLVREGYEPQVRDAVQVAGGWDLHTEERDGKLLARMTRKVPRNP